MQSSTFDWGSPVRLGGRSGESDHTSRETVSVQTKAKTERKGASATLVTLHETMLLTEELKKTVQHVPFRAPFELPFPGPVAPRGCQKIWWLHRDQIFEWAEKVRTCLENQDTSKSMCKVNKQTNEETTKKSRPANLPYFLNFHLTWRVTSHASSGVRHTSKNSCLLRTSLNSESKIVTGQLLVIGSQIETQVTSWKKSRLPRKRAPGRYLPACRMAHTGTRSVTSPLAALKIRSFLRGGKGWIESKLLPRIQRHEHRLSWYHKRSVQCLRWDCPERRESHFLLI